MKALPDINTHFSDWYNDVVYRAELVDQSPVRGCMVIRPYGYAIWENIQKILDSKIKKTGHANAAFPLLIPESFIKKEAKHVAGFAPELAVVTHAGGKKLAEPLVVRPTSETIIHHMFSRWIRSWRDLPMKVNQWCSIIGWELRTRPFIRTTEIWWQEGHTAHETHKEAEEEARLMLNQYVDLIENFLAVPIVAAEKSESERFAGADITFTMEGLMPDGKALQMGTSHLISQSFARSFEMTYQNREGGLSYPHLTSWGVTTRLIGALVMTHGDQKGLVIPPRIAPIQVIVIPIIKGEKADEVISAAHRIKEILAPRFKVEVDDDRHETPGAKFYKWELKGVPVRIEIGPRDLAKNEAVVTDRLGLGKESHPIDRLPEFIDERLRVIQKQLYQRAHERRAKQWHSRKMLGEFCEDLEKKGGFYQTGWCGSTACEDRIKECKATIRCVLPDREFTICSVCGKDSPADVLVAKAY